MSTPSTSRGGSAPQRSRRSLAIAVAVAASSLLTACPWRSNSSSSRTLDAAAAPSGCTHDPLGESRGSPVRNGASLAFALDRLWIADDQGLSAVSVRDDDVQLLARTPMAGSARDLFGEGRYLVVVREDRAALDAEPSSGETSVFVTVFDPMRSSTQPAAALRLDGPLLELRHSAGLLHLALQRSGTADRAPFVEFVSLDLGDPARPVSIGGASIETGSAGVDAVVFAKTGTLAYVAHRLDDGSDEVRIDALAYQPGRGFEARDAVLVGGPLLPEVGLFHAPGQLRALAPDAALARTLRLLTFSAESNGALVPLRSTAIPLSDRSAQTDYVPHLAHEDECLSVGVDDPAAPLELVDLRDPRTPVLRPVRGVTGAIDETDRDGDLLFVRGHGEDGATFLHAVDLRDPSDPHSFARDRITGSWPRERRPADLVHASAGSVWISTLHTSDDGALHSVATRFTASLVTGTLDRVQSMPTDADPRAILQEAGSTFLLGTRTLHHLSIALPARGGSIPLTWSISALTTVAGQEIGVARQGSTSTLLVLASTATDEISVRASSLLNLDADSLWPGEDFVDVLGRRPDGRSVLERIDLRDLDHPSVVATLELADATAAFGVEQERAAFGCPGHGTPARSVVQLEHGALAILGLVEGRSVVEVVERGEAVPRLAAEIPLAAPLDHLRPLRADGSVLHASSFTERPEDPSQVDWTLARIDLSDPGLPVFLPALEVPGEVVLLDGGTNTLAALAESEQDGVRRTELRLLRIANRRTVELASVELLGPEGDVLPANGELLVLDSIESVDPDAPGATRRLRRLSASAEVPLALLHTELLGDAAVRLLAATRALSLLGTEAEPNTGRRALLLVPHNGGTGNGELRFAGELRQVADRGDGGATLVLADAGLRRLE